MDTWKRQREAEHAFRSARSAWRAAERRRAPAEEIEALRLARDAAYAALLEAEGDDREARGLPREPAPPAPQNAGDDIRAAVARSNAAWDRQLEAERARQRLAGGSDE